MKEGIVKVCAWCGQGRKKSEGKKISHGICPRCLKHCLEQIKGKKVA